MRGLVPAIAAISLWSSAMFAHAEVRLQRGASPARVRLQPTASGPWSAVGPHDSALLNPEGDLAGDGTPTVVPGKAATAVIWSTARSGGLGLAVATDAWHRPTWVAGLRVTGTPSMVRIGDGWCAAWTSPEGSSRAAFIAADGALVESPLELDGVLVTLSADANTAHVLTADDDRLVLWSLAGYIPTPVPTPFPITRTTILTASRSESGILSAGEPMRFAADPPRFYSLSKPGGRSGLALVWWLSPNEARVVEVVPEGGLLPATSVERAHHGSGELLRALRDLAGR